MVRKSLRFNVGRRLWALIALCLIAVSNLLATSVFASMPISSPWPANETWQGSGSCGGSYYGEDYHARGGVSEFAIDFNRYPTCASDIGFPIVSVLDGKIISAGWRNEWGNCVEIDHGQFDGHTVTSFYAHFQDGKPIVVKKGEIVRQGQVIGFCGMSGGTSTGVHLHFELRENGRSVQISSMDGYNYCDAQSCRGHVITSQNSMLLDHLYSTSLNYRNPVGATDIPNQVFGGEQVGFGWQYDYTPTDLYDALHCSRNCYQKEHPSGRIVYDPLCGARYPFAIYGTELGLWLSGDDHGPRSAFGMPITNAYNSGQGRRQDFQKGYILNGNTNPWDPCAPGWTASGWNSEFSYLVADAYDRNGAAENVGAPFANAVPGSPAEAHQWDFTNKNGQPDQVWIQNFHDGTNGEGAITYDPDNGVYNAYATNEAYYIYGDFWWRYILTECPTTGQTGVAGWGFVTRDWYRWPNENSSTRRMDFVFPGTGTMDERGHYMFWDPNDNDPNHPYHITWNCMGATFVDAYPEDPSGILNFRPGEIVSCYVDFQNNNETETWDNVPGSGHYVELRSVTSDWNSQEPSPLAYNWIDGSNYRLATTQGPISPGGVGRYNFQILVPSTPGIHELRLKLYHEIAGYLADEDAHVRFRVQVDVDPVGYWSFDDGTAHDNSHWHNDGTVNGATPVAGIINNALSFDGINDYVEIPDDVTLRPYHITLSAWVKPDSINHKMNIFAKSVWANAQAEQYGMGINADGKAFISIKRNSGGVPGQGWYHANGQTVLQRNQWYLVTGTWDGIVLRIYVNGNLEATNTAVPAGPIDDISGGSLKIGNWWADFPDRFDGIIDEARIYNRALDQSEIANLYDLYSPNPTYISGIVGNLTLTPAGNPYIVTSNLKVGTTYQVMQTLTLQPGVRLRFNPGTGLYVGWMNGTSPRYGCIVANGTAEQPIVFTSNSDNPQPGDWVGIKLSGPSNAPHSDNLIHCDVKYAGGVDSLFSYAQSGVYLSSDIYTNYKKLDHCLIDSTLGSGVIIAYPYDSVLISSSRIINSSGHGIQNNSYRLKVGGDSLTTCDIFGNTGMNLVNFHGNAAEARYNYWGTTDSISIASKISGNVNWIPWSDHSICSDGIIAGRVIDPYNGVILDSVLIRLLQYGVEIAVDTTDQYGRYGIQHLAPGLYDVEASKNGYVSNTSENTSVNACEVANINFELQPYSPFCGTFEGLFCDGVDAGPSPLWTNLLGSCNWFEDNGSIRSSNSGIDQICVQSVLNPSWYDYVYQFDVRGNAGVDKEVTFRSQNGFNTYDANLAGNPINELYLNKVINGASTRLATVPFDNRNGIWYHLRVSCIGHTITVFINGNQALQYTDNMNPFLNGGVGLVNWTGQTGICDVSFDNISVIQPPLGIAVDYIEVNQGLADSLITLIPGKDIAIRTYLFTSNPSPIYNVTGGLHILQNGNEIAGSPFSPYPTTMIVKNSYSEADLDDAKNSLNFYFDSLSEGSYESYLVVNGQESLHKNFELGEQLTLDISNRELNILVIPFKDYQGNTPSMSMLDKNRDFMNQVYPIKNNKVKLYYPCGKANPRDINAIFSAAHIQPGPLNTDDRKNAIAQFALKEMKNWNKNSRNPKSNIVAVYLPQGNLGKEGTVLSMPHICLLTVSVECVVALQDRVSITLAHEVGHTLGFGEEYDYDRSGYLRCDNNPAPSGECNFGNEYGNYVERSGFSPKDKSVRKNIPLIDQAFGGYDSRVCGRWQIRRVGFMGQYGILGDGMMWVTKTEYNYLNNNIQRISSQNPLLKLEGDSTFLLISGMIYGGGSGIITASYPITTSWHPSLEGRFSLLSLDGNLLPIDSVFFDLPVTEDDPNPDSSIFVSEVGINQNTSKILLRINQEIIDSIIVSPNLPTISIIAPANYDQPSGNYEIIWSGHDQDGDSLTYNVYYSTDTLSWQLLLAGTRDTSVIYDFSLLPGALFGYIKVEASDGFNSAYAISNGFEMNNHAPIININSPADNAVYSQNSLIILSGFGIDVEDGELPDAVLAWYSSINDTIGKGKRLTIDSLSSGIHTIILSGHDSNGNVAADTISVSVSNDSDNDGMPDDWERAYGLDTLMNDSQVDLDGDSLVNIDEYYWHTNPRLLDTDGDKFPDGVEIKYNTNPIDSLSLPADFYAFNLAGPENGKIEYDSSFAFTWHPAVGLNVDTLKYILYYSTDSLFASADSIIGISDTTYAVNPHLTTGIYWWYVTVENMYGYRACSADIYKLYLSLDPANLALNPPSFSTVSLADSIIWDTLRISNTGLGFLEVNIFIEPVDSTNPGLDSPLLLGVIGNKQVQKAAVLSNFSSVDGGDVMIPRIGRPGSQNKGDHKPVGYRLTTTAWLVISQSSAIISPQSSLDVIVACNTDGISPGDYLDKIRISDNSTINPDTSIDYALRVERPLGLYNLILPENGDTLKEDSVTFVWSKSSTEYASDTVSYLLLYSLDSTFASQDSLGPIGDTSMVILTQILSDLSTYWWKVEAVSDSVNIGRCSENSLNFLTKFHKCDYVIGDANNSHSFTGLDVTYSVRYFKGGPLPPYSCECTPGHIWYVAGDVNGSCTFSGLDVTYMVRYFKGGAAPIPCPDCPPGGLLIPLSPREEPTPAVQPILIPIQKAKPKALGTD
jgi:hypothetical protein